MNYFNETHIHICAEIGINANKDLSIAKKIIERAKLAGADAVKLQKRDIESCYTKEELDAPRVSPWGNTTREQKYGIEFDYFDYLELSSFCQDLNINLYSSPWDLKSIEFLTEFGFSNVKIPSALATNKEFLKKCCESERSILLSTGMLNLSKIMAIVRYIEDHKGKLDLIYHCTSSYPSKPEELNLLGIQTLKRNFPSYAIGYSGHEKGTSMTLAAVALGAVAVERHVTLDKNMYGSDQSSSLDMDEFAQLVSDIRTFEKARGNGSIKVYESELPIIKKLRKVDDFT